MRVSEALSARGADLGSSEHQQRQGQRLPSGPQCRARLSLEPLPGTRPDLFFPPSAHASHIVLGSVSPPHVRTPPCRDGCWPERSRGAQGCEGHPEKGWAVGDRLEAGHTCRAEFWGAGPWELAGQDTRPGPVWSAEGPRGLGAEPRPGISSVQPEGSCHGWSVTAYSDATSVPTGTAASPGKEGTRPQHADILQPGHRVPQARGWSAAACRHEGEQAQLGRAPWC